MINFKQYKVKRGIYGGIELTTVTIPSDIVYVTGGKHDVGHSLSNGHLHYIGIVKGNYDDVSKHIKGLATSVHKFNGEYCFVTLSDVQFISQAPEIINPDILSESQYIEKLNEWNSQIDFNKYYIAFYTKEMKLAKMAKIQQIKSEYEIDTCLVHTSNEFNTSLKFESIELSNMDLRSFCLDGYSINIIGKVVEGEIADKYWNTLIYNVLKPLNLELIDNLNILKEGLTGLDKAHKITSDFIHNGKFFNGKELEDLLYMKTI